ncbi:MAG: DUF4364 family protein [Oscillospiraceae bacterium]|nr:DUF4364 family protein [Oscillospiraceae bacterium]
MQLGFSGDELSMKILILYALDKLNNASLDDLQQLVFIQEDTDYFLFAAATGQLVDAGQLEEIEGGFAITQHGREAVGAMLKTLPAAMRDECDRVALQLLERRTLQAALDVKIIEHGGKYSVALRLNDNDIPMFDLTMAVGDLKQAKRVVKKFQGNASWVYQRVLELLDSL